MIDRPNSRRFIAMMTLCALTLTGVVLTGIGGLPVLVLASIVVLGVVDASYTTSTAATERPRSALSGRPHRTTSTSTDHVVAGGDGVQRPVYA